MLRHNITPVLAVKSLTSLFFFVFSNGWGMARGERDVVVISLNEYLLAIIVGTDRDVGVGGLISEGFKLSEHKGSDLREVPVFGTFENGHPGGSGCGIVERVGRVIEYPEEVADIFSRYVFMGRSDWSVMRGSIPDNGVGLGGVKPTLEIHRFPFEEVTMDLEHDTLD